MVEENKRVLVISRDSSRYSSWLELLQVAGWQICRVNTRDEALEHIPQFLPVLMFIDVEAGEHIDNIEEHFAQRCRDSGLAVIPILTNPTVKDVADSYRRGAVDVLIEPFDSDEMLDVITRVGSFKDLYRENMDYRAQLEHANQDLKDSLNTLKMDQQAGREVQLNILPREPLIHAGYEIEHKIVPSLYLSGDFVGYSVLFDRFIIFWFADVSGHGASSAFVTVMLSFLMRQISRRHIYEDDVEPLLHAPQGLLEHINRQILAMNIDKHLTMFAGSIDTQRDVLRYVTGAQLPMPIMVAETGAEFLTGKGKPIGLYEDANWAVEEIALPKNFSLVIASDGLLDYLEGDSIAAKEQVFLEACEHAEMTHNGICAALKIGSISDAPDDVSVLTIVRNPGRG
ncbi:MAG: fused response regulator/phosphatase [Gammaproteobacteria bacterium]|nr:MAG: fused response regulator/phosphatase [Gammaproteobacteria bacterium]